jgi:hypothetical protein
VCIHGRKYIRYGLAYIQFLLVRFSCGGEISLGLNDINAVYGWCPTSYTGEHRTLLGRIIDLRPFSRWGLPRIGHRSIRRDPAQVYWPLALRF